MAITLSENNKWLASQYRTTNLWDLLAQKGIVLDDNIIDVLTQFATQSNIETATGIWLDYIGYRLGIFNRPSVESMITEDSMIWGLSPWGEVPWGGVEQDFIPFNDDIYRLFLKSRALQLISDTSIADFTNVLEAFYGSGNIAVTDNDDMSIVIQITLVSPITLDISESAIQKNNLVPKITGVLINYYYSGGGMTFGLTPWGIAPWGGIRTVPSN